jgi:hypothetical protein
MMIWQCRSKFGSAWSGLERSSEHHFYSINGSYEVLFYTVYVTYNMLPTIYVNYSICYHTVYVTVQHMVLAVYVTIQYMLPYGMLPIVYVTIQYMLPYSICYPTPTHNR